MLTHIFKDFLKLSLLLTILLITNCTGQLKSCTEELNGEKISTHGADGKHIIFRLSAIENENSLPSCPTGETIVPLSHDDVKLAPRRKFLTKHLWTELPDLYFTNKGVFGLKEGNHTHYYYPDEFCVTILERGRIGSPLYSTLGIRLCNPSCKGTTPCIKKCCPMEQAFNLSSGVCEPTKLKWSPFLYSEATSGRFTPKSKFRPHYINYILECSAADDDEDPYDYWFDKTLPSVPQATRTKFKLLEDGTIFTISGRREWSKWTNQNFCIDAITSSANRSRRAKSNVPESEQVVIMCREIQEEQSLRFTSILYSGVMYFASIFLLLTCFVYLLLWDQQNIHGWTVFSLVLTMFFMFIFMGSSNLLKFLSSSSNNLQGSPLCVVNGILAHYFFLSTFIWLSIINLDLFLTLRSVTISKKSSQIGKYIVYAIVSWGIPILVVCTGITLDYVYPDDESLVPVPDYGREVCFITLSAQGIYLFYIIGFLWFFNLVFISATFYIFFSTKKDALSLRSHNTSQFKTLVIVTKLLIIQGVTWIFELISWLLTKDEGGQAWYWYEYVVDACNLSQAVLIFIIFVCKRTTIVQLEQKYPLCKRIFTSNEKKKTESLPFVRIYKSIK